MRKKKHKFSIDRIKARFITFGSSAIECIKSYPTVRREVPITLMDVISVVCVLGVMAIMVVFTLTSRVGVGL